ncbi:MAG: carbohydrate binding domain-containing protein, partial [Ruminococcus sp.]|nr:carbohydrate binding domain-containing protein [Ruminococcus sp.]
MKHKTTKAIIGSLVSASMLMTSAAFAMPASAEHIVWEDFNETPIVLPWVPVSSQPAMQDFCVQDGRLEIKILNNRGPEGRWDLQLRRRGLTMIQGHEYTVKCTITADDDGYIYSKIGNYTGEKEYWHNLGGQEWMPYHITKGETYEFEDTFVLKDSPVGPTEWSFMYADNQGMYNNNDTGMPDGSTITFDDLELIDNTGSGGCGYYLRSDEELY